MNKKMLNALIASIVVSASSATADQIILQNGLNGYNGTHDAWIGSITNTGPDNLFPISGTTGDSILTLFAFETS